MENDNSTSSGEWFLPYFHTSLPFLHPFSTFIIFPKRQKEPRKPTEETSGCVRPELLDSYMMMMIIIIIIFHPFSRIPFPFLSFKRFPSPISAFIKVV
jgi:hypothetical protein